MPPRKDTTKVSKTTKKPVAAAAAKKASDPKTKKAAAEPTTARKATTKAALPEKEKKTTAKTAAAAKRAASAEPAKKVAPAKAKKTPAASKKTEAAPKKPSAAAKKADESDKENDLASAQTNTRVKTATKRKREDDDVEEEEEEEKKKEEERAAPSQSKKKARTVAPAARVRKGVAINTAPTKVLEVFVFGEGSSGELGLGSVKVDGKKPIDVKRPRLNASLKNVVQIACGGMHVAALTTDNEILTWGVNDQGALGRNTSWDGGLRDVDAEDSDDEDDDSGLNPRESTPTKAELPEGITWVQVVACDSATFALTDDGHVWGWGTFRSNDGILGFRKGYPQNVVTQPMWIDDLKNIVDMASGANHVLVRDNKGKVFAWGAGQQCQLARKPLERDVQSSLVPSGIGSLARKGSKKVTAAGLAAGSYHSFVVDSDTNVWGFGLNNYAELAIPDEVGVDGGNILKPTFVEALEDYQVAHIAGGTHHSLACTEDGKLLTWGRIDGYQVGLPTSVFNEDNSIYDEHNKPRILKAPTEVPDLPFISFVAAGTDHNLAITKDGRVYSWGFSANYQTGQGTTEDIELPTLIDNSAIRDKKITWAGAGGQFSILAAVKEDQA